MTTIFLDRITKVYGGRKGVVALEDLTLKIREGEFVGLLGPSGCGKTTTLRILAGLERPTKGKVYFNDEDVTNLGPDRRNIAMVFQFPVLYPSLNVYDNIALSLDSAKLSKQTIRERIIEAAEIVGISEYLNMRTQQLDLATKQKVVLAKTLVRDPTIFLLDEPLSLLDPKLRTAFRTKIKEIQLGMKKPMVYVTHDQTEALTLSDKIAVMNEGKVLQYDTPENLYTNPSVMFVGWFIGSPGMNLIKCDVLVEDEKTYLATESGFKYDISFLGDVIQSKNFPRKVILGIRPEHIQINAQGGMTAELTQVEYMGNIVILNLKINDVLVKAKAHKSVLKGSDKKILLNIPKERITLFDDTGRRILL
ncbi:MAG: ABC transporter ATP-binding protein [Nitrososphaerota archaeon]